LYSFIIVKYFGLQILLTMTKPLCYLILNYYVCFLIHPQQGLC